MWGYRNDWDAGLMHVGARYYEVETGRFIQKDPKILAYIFYPQSLNKYTYCENSCVNDIDPDGHHRYRRRRKCKYKVKYIISKIEIEEYEYIRDPHGNYGCGDIVPVSKVKYKIQWFTIYEAPWGWNKLPDCEEQGTMGPGCGPCEGHPPKRQGIYLW